MICKRDKQVRNRAERQANGRFAPGASGNPKGRPKIGASLSELIRNELDRPMRGGRTRKERLAEVIVERALAGDHRFCRLVMERVEPAQQPGEESSMSYDEFVRCLRISASIPYQSEESRQHEQRLLDAIDAYRRELDEMDDEEDDEALAQLAEVPLPPYLERRVENGKVWIGPRKSGLGCRPG